MKRALVFLVISLLTGMPVLAQEIGDQSTAGYSGKRAYLNSDMGRFVPPLKLVRTFNLSGVSSADSFTVFDDVVLIGEGDPNPAYAAFDLPSGNQLWRRPLAGSVANLDYIPPFSNDIVLLGDPSTTTVAGVQVSTGLELWQESIGTPQSRYSLLGSRRAVYHGSDQLNVANPTTGTIFWQYTTTTAAAALATSSDQVYLLERNGILDAFDASDGTVVWQQVGVGLDGSTILAAEKYVFVVHPGVNQLLAINAYDGNPVWALPIGNPAQPAIIQAYGLLFTFSSNDGQAQVSAHFAMTGQLVWTVTDPSIEAGLPVFGLAANNTIYFYNSGSQRIRALDAFTGNTIWSIAAQNVRGLAAVKGSLYVLYDDRIEIYAPANTIYLAQIADSGGASTLITLVNLGEQPSTGTLDFLADDGTPLALKVVGRSVPTSSLSFTIPANSSSKIQTEGISQQAVSGWARASADQPLSGTSVYQFTDNGQILFEAGVGATPLTGLARVFVSRISNAAEGQFSTGIAIANPLDETAQVEIEFRRVLPTELDETIQFNLNPLQHTARFLEEAFISGIAGPGAEGTLIIRSDIPLVITALRTQNGFQMASYPVGQ